jgi:hypothetical protein
MAYRTRGLHTLYTVLILMSSIRNNFYISSSACILTYEEREVNLMQLKTCNFNLNIIK